MPRPAPRLLDLLAGPLLALSAWSLAWPAWRAALDAWRGPLGPGWILLGSIVTFQLGLGALRGALLPLPTRRAPSRRA